MDYEFHNDPEQIERLGCLVDTLENFIAAGTMPGMPDHIKLQALTEALPGWRDEVKDIFFKLGGDAETWD